MRKIGFSVLVCIIFSVSFLAPVFAVDNHIDSSLVSEENEEGIGDFEDDPFAEESTDAKIADPIESFNRASFWFNDKLYFYLLKPVARVYRVVPEQGRKSVSNFFSNLATPVRFANSLLQLKFTDAGRELGRLALNTTVGVGGLLDPAKSLGMDKKEEDFGQTLGRYGLGQGFYLVIPVLGPSSLRDGVGRVADSFLDPMTYVLAFPERIGAKAFDTVNYISLDKDTYESIKKDALDPYLFIRNAYAQRREALTNK
ncbi:MAG: VacJ family lipoprotein [Deltaproteobacteria bacterium]|nr:VacJ family lipoprotein [Deltaproteobacteria bacterium]